MKNGDRRKETNKFYLCHLNVYTIEFFPKYSFLVWHVDFAACLILLRTLLVWTVLSKSNSHQLQKIE